MWSTSCRGSWWSGASSDQQEGWVAARPPGARSCCSNSCGGPRSSGRCVLNARWGERKPHVRMSQWNFSPQGVCSKQSSKRSCLCKGNTCGLWAKHVACVVSLWLCQWSWRTLWGDWCGYMKWEIRGSCDERSNKFLEVKKSNWKLILQCCNSTK